MNLQREIAKSLVLVVPLDCSEEAIQIAIAEAYATEQMLKKFLAAEITFEDYLEAIEPFVPSIDEYIEEAEESLIETQDKWQQLIL